MALTQIRIGSLDNFHQYDDAVYATGAEFSQPIIAGDATAATHLLTRNNLWGGTNYINGNLLINTGDALGVSDVGLVVGDIGAGTGWVLNAKGQGSWVTGLSLHGQSLAAGVAWQRETVGGLEPIDVAFVMDLGDQVIGGYNYKVTATGAYVGGAQWDQSARQFNVRGHLTALSLAVGPGISITIDTSATYGQISFTSVGSIFGAAATNNLLVAPAADNTQSLYLGTGSTARFASVIQYGLTFQWYRSATLNLQLDNSGLDLKVGAFLLNGSNLNTIFAASVHTHSYAAVSHSHAGSDITSGTLGIGVSAAAQIATSLASASAIYASAGGIRSDSASAAAGYFPNGDVTIQAIAVRAMLVDHEARLDAHGI